MKVETASEILKREIIFLEKKRSEDLNKLKVNLNTTLENIKPINVLNNFLEDVNQSPETKNNLLQGAVGMTSGYVLKKLVFKSSHNPFKILAGVAFEAFVTKLATKNADKITNTAISIFKIVKSLVKHKRKETLAID